MSEQQPSDAQEQAAPTAKKSGTRWIAIVVLMLTGHVIAVSVLIVSSSGDPSHQVIPDYYKKAMAWDRHMAQQKTNDELGWKLEFSLARMAAKNGERVGRVRVAVTLRDRLGAALRGAHVKVVAFHKARAARVLEGNLGEQAPGRYSAELRMVRLGFWQLDFVVTRGQQRFTKRVDRELLAAGKLAAAPLARGAP